MPFFQVKVVAGDTHSAAGDFDSRIVDLCVRYFNRENRGKVTIKIDFLFHGVDTCSGIPGQINWAGLHCTERHEMETSSEENTRPRQ